MEVCSMAPTHPLTHTHALALLSLLAHIFSPTLAHTLPRTHSPTPPLSHSQALPASAPRRPSSCVCVRQWRRVPSRAPLALTRPPVRPPPRPCLCMLMQAPFTDTSTWYLARHFTQKNTRSPARSRANPRGRFVDPVSPPRLRLYHSCRHSCSYKCAFPHYRPCHFAAPIPP